MPFMKKINGKSVRDYAAELRWEKENKPKRVLDRAQRNKARSIMRKKLGSAAIKNKDIGHKKALSKGGVTTLANLFVQSSRTNRSFSRNAKGAMISERSKRGK